MMEHIQDYKIRYGYICSTWAKQMFLKMHLKHWVPDTKTLSEVSDTDIIMRSMMNVVEQLRKQMLIIFHLDTQVQI